MNLGRPGRGGADKQSHRTESPRLQCTGVNTGINTTYYGTAYGKTCATHDKNMDYCQSNGKYKNAAWFASPGLRASACPPCHRRAAAPHPHRSHEPHSGRGSMHPSRCPACCRCTQSWCYVSAACYNEQTKTSPSNKGRVFEHVFHSTASSKLCALPGPFRSPRPRAIRCRRAQDLVPALAWLLVPSRCGRLSASSH